jgi:HJR/Mrr/RecB family endonuclease
MQLTYIAENFYWESLVNSDGITIVYEYALESPPTKDISVLRASLHDKFNVSITIEGLNYLINTITKELQQQPTFSPLDRNQSRPWEHIVTNLDKKAGMSFPGELLDFVFQAVQASKASSQALPSTLPKRMTGSQFETFLQKLFEKRGYYVTRTKSSHDYGADLILGKQGECIVVQAKKRKTVIGIRAIQEAFSSMGYYDADHAIVITTGTYSRPAIQLARKLGVECWDWQRLQAELRKTLNNEYH